MTPRSAGRESGKKGRSTPRLDRAPGIRNVQTALRRGTGGRRARIQDTKPKEDRMAASRGGGGGRQNDPRGARASGVVLSTQVRAGGYEAGRRKNGARELSGLREGDPRAARGSPRAPEERPEGSIQGQGFRVRGDGGMPLELPSQSETPVLSADLPHCRTQPLAPPALLFVSQSGRNRLLLAAGRAGGCRLVNACFQPRLSQSECGSVFF